MRYKLLVILMLLFSGTSAQPQLSIGVALPGISIGINLPLYPELVRVPGYPVYYAPQIDSNFFFYDGMYWVYQSDNWYASSWYNGPWGMVGPEFVPLFVLRIPVRYYRSPPAYFRGWRPDAPPRWGAHWGNEWEQRRTGWDRWNHNAAPAAAPLPNYQRKYSGQQYPRMEQQQTIHNNNYRYQPRETIVRQHYQEQARPAVPAPAQRRYQETPQERGGRAQEVHKTPTPPSLPQEVRPAAPIQQRPQPQPAPPQHEQQAPRTSQEIIPQGNGMPQEPRRSPAGQEKDHERGGEGRGQERNR
jgi:hypothetical protein